MRPNIERRYPRAIDAEYDPQISVNHGTVNRVFGFCRERVDFVRPESGMKWIALECLPSSPDQRFLR